jgi:hypothetical protein
MKILVFVFGFLMSSATMACDISFNVELQTFGENVTVELRSGSPGKSRPVASHREGGSVSVICALVRIS